MQYYNLRGEDMVKRKKFRNSKSEMTETTSGNKWTNIQNPKASSRFKIGDRVAWDDGESLILGRVLAFDLDDCALKVQLENGSKTVWSSVSARLRRVQTADYDSIKSVSEITPIGKQLKDDEETSLDYSKFGMDYDSETTQPVEKVELMDTIFGDDEWEK